MCVGEHVHLDQFLEERRGLMIWCGQPSHNAARVSERVRHVFPQRLADLRRPVHLCRTRDPETADRRRATGLKFAGRLAGRRAALMRLADTIVAVSEEEKRQIEQLGCGPVHVWGNPVSARPPELDFDQRADLLLWVASSIPDVR